MRREEKQVRWSTDRVGKAPVNPAEHPKSYKLLLVEDNPGDADLIAERLAFEPGQKYDIIHATGLKSALNTLEETPVDAIVLDLNLPDSTGIETLRAVKTAQGEVPIIVLSSSAREDLIMTALREGAQDFLDKTSQPEKELSRSILYAVERCWGEQGRRQIEKLVTASPDAVIVVDERGVVQFVNTAAQALFQKSRNEFVGRPFDFPTRDGQTSEIEIRREDEIRIAEMRVVSVKWQGAPSLLATIRDVTEQKVLSAQMRQAQRLQALGTLTGGIAHDFNNLLVAIVSSAELGKDDLPPDSPLRTTFDTIYRAGIRARELVSQILVFSRQQESARQPLNLHDLVEESLPLLKTLSMAGIRISADVPKHLPNVVGDSTQIHQVIINLSSNAIHAMLDNPGELKISAEEVSIDGDLDKGSVDVKPGRYVRLIVSDTGKGMPQSIQDRIFEPFFTTKRQGDGTGLGLSVVHGIVKNHQGAISVTSRPGVGSTFYVYLPVAVANPPEQAKSAEPTVEEVKANIGARTLFVDDDEALVFLLSRQLKKLGFEISAYVDCQEALQAFRSDPWAFDHVITDLSMVTMTGIEFTKEILAIRPDITVIVTSGYVRPEDARAALEAGAKAMIQKPATVEDMVKLLQSAVTNR